MIMEILNICMSKECRVWTIKDNYRLGEDIQSKVLALPLASLAEIERNLISQRTKALSSEKSRRHNPKFPTKRTKTAPEKHKLFHKKALIQAP